MSTADGYARLATALREDYDSLVSRWVDAYQQSAIRLPGPVREGQITQLASPILESLAEMMSSVPAADEAPMSLSPGTPASREVEKSAAFIGGTMSSTDANGFDVAALVLTLRDVLFGYAEGATQTELNAFFEWLAILAVDSHSAARGRAQRDKMREELEEGTPVVLVQPELPAAMLIGSPELEVLNSVFARLMLTIVRVGAPAVIVDGEGLTDAGADEVLTALTRFIGHRKLVDKVEVIAVGLDPKPEKAWLAVAKQAGATMSVVQSFDRAVARGLDVLGCRVVKLGS